MTGILVFLFVGLSVFMTTVLKVGVTLKQDSHRMDNLAHSK